MDTTASRQLLQIMVENAPLAMAMFDKDMRYIVANANWVKEFRLEGEKVIGQSQFDVFPGLHESWRNIYNTCLNGQVERCEEDVFQRTDGTRDWVRWEVRPWMTSEMEVGGLLICCQIVTRLKEFEQQLQFESAFARTLLGPRSLVMVVDRKGAIIRSSEGAQSISGETSPELGSSFAGFFPPIKGTKPEELLAEVFAPSETADQPSVVTTQQAGGLGGEIAWQVLPAGEAADAQAALLVGVEVPAGGSNTSGGAEQGAVPVMNVGAQAALARLSGANPDSLVDAEREVGELKKDKATLNTEVTELRKQCGRAAKELRAAKEEREELTKVREADQSQIASLRAELDSKELDLKKFEGSKEKFESLSKEREKLSADCDRLETRVVELKNRQRSESDDFAKERAGLLEQLKLGKNDLRDLQEQVKTAELGLGEIETLTLEVEDLREKLSAEEATSKKYHETRRLLAEKSEEVERLSGEAGSLRSELEEKEKQLTAANLEAEERQALERRVAQLGDEKDSLLAEKETLSTKTEDLSSRLAAADGAASDRARDFEAANAGLQLEMSALRKQLVAKEEEGNRLVDAEGELSVLNASLKTASDERENLLTTVASLEEAHRVADRADSAKVKELESLRNEKVELLKRLETLEGQSAEGEKSANALQEKLQAAEADLSQMKANTEKEGAAHAELQQLLSAAQAESHQIKGELTQLQNEGNDEAEGLNLRLTEAESELALMGIVPEHTPFGLVLLAPGGEVIYRNPPFAQLLGHDPEPGSAFDDLLRAGSPDPEHTDNVLDEWKEKIWRKQATRTFSLASAEGLIKEIEFRPTLLEDGRLLLSARDVTEQLRGEEALRASEIRFRSLFQDAPVGVALVDSAGEIFDINPALEGLLGCRRLEMRRAAMADFMQSGGAEDYKEASSLVASGESRCGEADVVLLQADGGELPASLSIGAVRSKGGELLFTTVFFDPTKSTPQSAAAIQLGDPGRDTYQRMRSSLRIISSLINLQIASDSEAPARAALTASEGRVRAIGLLYEHLETAEDRSGVSFGQYLQRLTDRLVDAIPAPIPVTLTVSSENIRLPVDRAVILGLIANELISNALMHAYTAEGLDSPGRVQVTLKGISLGEGDGIRLSIADDGVGLPENFDPEDATGFGLSIARTLCEQLGGELDWESLETGMEFGVGFPSVAAH